MLLNEFIKKKRGSVRLTQPELAEKAGVGLRFVRELERGKATLRMDKINQVLKLFGYEMGPVEIKRGYTEYKLEVDPDNLHITGKEVVYIPTGNKQ